MHEPVSLLRLRRLSHKQWTVCALVLPVTRNASKKGASDLTCSPNKKRSHGQEEGWPAASGRAGNGSAVGHTAPAFLAPAINSPAPAQAQLG